MTVLAHRLAVPADMALVVDSWVDSYRTAHAAGMVPMPLYAGMMRECVAWVLDRPGVEVWVAYRPGEEPPHDLYGWLAVERGVQMPHRVRQRVDGRMQWVEEMADAGCPLVHYVYTKEAFREHHGVARGLFAAAGVDLADRFLYTCKTALSSQLASKAPNAHWMPLLARYPKTTLEAR